MIFDNLIRYKKGVLELVLSFENKDNNLLITYFNQHCFNIYKTEPNYNKIIEDFHIYPDGFGLYLVLKIFFRKKIEKYNASDLNEEIINSLSKLKKRIFVVGGNFSNAQICNAINNGNNICGYQNGFFSEQEENEIINNIESNNPDVIFVAMGVPKQEYFAVKLAEYVKGKIVICAGNFFEYYLGNMKRIPEKLRNLGIEWLFRLFAEPKRLWKRYILGIPVFFFLLLRELMNNNFSKK